jgi:hypothetical protein
VLREDPFGQADLFHQDRFEIGERPASEGLSETSSLLSRVCRSSRLRKLGRARRAAKLREQRLGLVDRSRPSARSAARGPASWSRKTGLRQCEGSRRIRFTASAASPHSSY